MARDEGDQLMPRVRSGTADRDARTFILPDWAMEALFEIGQGRDLGETLLHVIADYQDIRREDRAGADILVHRDGQYRRLRWQ
jgi:hypothetical protein